MLAAHRNPLCKCHRWDELAAVCDPKVNTSKMERVPETKLNAASGYDPRVEGGKLATAKARASACRSGKNATAVVLTPEVAAATKL